MLTLDLHQYGDPCKENIILNQSTSATYYNKFAVQHSPDLSCVQ